MKIVIIRHGKVKYNWRKWSTSEEYDRDCAGYDTAPIENIKFEVPDPDYENVYISTLRRSRDTAVNTFGRRRFLRTAWIDEVPLKSGFDTGRRLPRWFWDVLARLQWFFNSPRQEEKRTATNVRARRFVAALLRKGADSAVVTHGFYMHTLLQEMKKAGFKFSKVRIAYKNGEYVVAEL